MEAPARGRKKGTPNTDKKELLAAIRDAVGDQDYHPVVQLALVATDTTMVKVTETKRGKVFEIEVAKYSDELKVSAAKEVAQYIAPKLKAIEHSAGDDGFGLNLFMQLGPKPNGKGKNGGSS